MIEYEHGETLKYVVDGLDTPGLLAKFKEDANLASIRGFLSKAGLRLEDFGKPGTLAAHPDPHPHFISTVRHLELPSLPTLRPPPRLLRNAYASPSPSPQRVRLPLASSADFPRVWVSPEVRKDPEVEVIDTVDHSDPNLKNMKARALNPMKASKQNPMKASKAG